MHINDAQGDLQAFSLDSLTDHVRSLAPDGLFTDILNLKATPSTPVRDLAHAWQQLLHMNEARNLAHGVHLTGTTI